MRNAVYLEKLSEFSALLRQEGLPVGVQETADACEILSQLDLSDRETVREALQAVYAKSREEQAAFRRAFDGFFVSAEKRDAIRRQREAEAREMALRRAQAERELQVRGRPIDLREDLREVYASMGEDKRQQLRQMLERTRGTMARSPDKLYSNFIRSVFMRFLLEQQMTMEDAAVGAEAVDPDLALLYRDISRFQDADVPRAAALIAAISRQLDAGPAGARAAAASWTSSAPSAGGWRPAAAFTGSPTGAGGRSGGGWCCCATCPGPCCNSRSSPCGLSSPCPRSPRPPRPSSSPRRSAWWTPLPCKIWTPSGTMSAPQGSMAGERTWDPPWRSSAAAVRLPWGPPPPF